MSVNHFFSIFFISVCCCFSDGKILNVEYAVTNETDHVMNIHNGLDGNASALVNITEQPIFPCKEETLAPGYTPWYSLDDVSLRHSGTLRRDSAGRRAYLELRLVLKVDRDVGIELWGKEGSGISYVLFIGGYNNQRTLLWYNGTLVLSYDSPFILSSTEFQSYYFKVDDGKLKFGKEGDDLLILYPGINLSSLNYYRLYTRNLTKLRYCPAVTEVLPCKEQTFAQHSHTSGYLLDDVSLHYGTLRRDSAGRLAHLELRLALQTDGRVDIDLLERENYSGSQYFIRVGDDSHQRTKLWYKGVYVQDISTPDILSATEFRSFYIKVDDGKLQFGKEGDLPLISYSNVDLRSLNLFQFDTYEGPTKIRFCPAAVEGSS